MNPEVQAALDRLRKHYKSIADDSKFRESPYARSGWGGVSWDAGALSEDESVLARMFMREHPEIAPNWYSGAEIYSWLRLLNYSDQIANELSDLIAINYQLAYNKGFSMGGVKPVDIVDPKHPDYGK